jgi:serine/threonine-protein kinase
LTIVVPAEAQVEGLVIERDGHALGPGAWSTAIPIDGGEHSVRASALGRDPFTTTIVIARESDDRTVEIPVLATPVVVVSRADTSLSATTLPSGNPAPRAIRLRWPGIVAAGVGVVLLGGAGYALATALKARDDSNSDCWIDGCDDAGVQKRNKAVARGDLATLLGIGGIALVATGATLLYFDRRSNASPAKNGIANASAARGPARIRARFLLGAAPGTVVTGIEGGF